MSLWSLPLTQAPQRTSPHLLMTLFSVLCHLEPNCWKCAPQFSTTALPGSPINLAKILLIPCLALLSLTHKGVLRKIYSMYFCHLKVVHFDFWCRRVVTVLIRTFAWTLSIIIWAWTLSRVVLLRFYQSSAASFAGFVLNFEEVSWQELRLPKRRCKYLRYWLRPEQDTFSWLIRFFARCPGCDVKCCVANHVCLHLYRIHRSIFGLHHTETAPETRILKPRSSLIIITSIQHLTNVLRKVRISKFCVVTKARRNLQWSTFFNQCVSDL